MKNYSYNKRKAGLPPGTILYTGNKANHDIEIELYSFDGSGVVKEKTDKTMDFKSIKSNGKFNWLNINGIHDTDVINSIGKTFEIDNLVLEDITNISQRIKTEDWGNYLFVVLKMVRFDEKINEIKYEQVSFILGKNYLLTFQEEPGDVFDSVRKRIDNPSSKIVQRGIGYLAYALIDVIVDNYFIVLDAMEEKIDRLESEILNSFSDEQAEKILNLKKELSVLKKGIYPIREISAKLQGTEIISYFGKTNKMYLSDLHDHGIVVCDIIENMISRMSELFQLYYSTQSNDMNNVMKVLAIISTIFMPLSFLAGIYGMNFGYMPELSWKYGYFLILGIMFLLAVIMIIIFKKKKWW